MHSNRPVGSTSPMIFMAPQKLSKKEAQSKSRFKRYLTNKNSPSKDENPANEYLKGSSKGIDRIVLNLNQNSNESASYIEFQ